MTTANPQSGSVPLAHGLSFSYRIAGGAPSAACRADLSFHSALGLWAQARLEFPRPLASASCRTTTHGTTLTLVFVPETSGGKSARWSLRLIPALDEPLIQLVEFSSIIAAPWRLNFPGQKAHTHNQLTIRPLAVGEKIRLGAFTQHGQLFDLRDYCLVENGDQCTAFLALHPGKWSQPGNVLTAEANSDGLEISLPLPHAPLRRAYLLAHVPAADVLKPEHLGIPYFEPETGHAAWPARRIARYGFARPERLVSYRRQAATCAQQASRFLLGSAQDFAGARERAKTDAFLAGADAFWAGDISAARTRLTENLARLANALCDSAYLHPLGNPVAMRDFAPLCILFHLLDFAGELSPQDRVLAVEQIATIAELLARRDFYPHHLATRPPEFPYGPDSLYRGMLNQNFNTDRYAAVGLAGCMLPDHPHARRWREHALEQFDQQMRAYVYPGGAWEESHTYANHVKLTLLPLILALRHAPEPIDLLADRRFGQMCRFHLLQVSPPDRILGGKRGVPAVGDHGYLHATWGELFGALATLSAGDRELYLWAFSQLDRGKANILSPLLDCTASASNISGSETKPMDCNPWALRVALPVLATYPGFGAIARSAAHTADESLLVVRCGEAWGHYHQDQGSFWWWSRGRLIAADSDLGSGPLKFAHAGHNVLGYPERTPMQYLGRHGFAITLAETDAVGTTRIRCYIPVRAWMVGPGKDEPIALREQPSLTRTFSWPNPDTLIIDDEPQKSPGGRVTWSLHVVAESVAAITAENVIHINLGDGAALRLQLPMTPLALTTQKHGATWHICGVYPEGALRHRLEVEHH